MKTSDDILDTQIAINRAIAVLIFLIIVGIGIVVGNQIGYAKLLASVFIIATASIFLIKWICTKKNKRDLSFAQLHQFIHNSGVYRQFGEMWARLNYQYLQNIQSRKGARVIQYSFGSYNPAVSHTHGLEILKGNQIIPFVVALYTDGGGGIGVKIALMKDIVTALKNGADRVEWRSWGHIPNDEWFDQSVSLSQFTLSAIFAFMDSRAALQYLNEPEYGHEIQCLVLEAHHHLLDAAPALDMSMLHRWCNRHLSMGDESFSWPAGDQLIPSLAQHISAITKHYSSRLPVSLTVLLGDYCLECKDEEPLRQYCFYLASAVGRTQKPDAHPQRKNAWLIKTVHGHGFLQGPLLAHVKTILDRYPAEQLDSYDEHYMKGYHYLYGAEAALERFPEGRRLFLCKDLGL